MQYHTGRDFAQRMDLTNPLRHFRDQFNIPNKSTLTAKCPPESGRSINEQPGIYLCGNQIGLQPRRTSALIGIYLKTWAEQGMYGLSKKLDDSGLPTWGEIDQVAARTMAPIVGALPHEVAVTGGLTTNLHVLMASFFRPNRRRTKVIIERDSFSSDHYAVQSQIQLHGLDVASNMVLVEPATKQTLYLSMSRILELIDENADSTALLLLSGVQYVTGQILDIAKITSYARSKGITVGWDLAHAVGNIELSLHEWEVDFAVWCNYKFMNAGPGVVGSIFVHEKHGLVDRSRGAQGYRPRLAGWWGNDMANRFAMEKSFVPSIGAAGYQLANVSVLDTVALVASLQVFEQTTMSEIRHVSTLLTGYLDYLLRKAESGHFEMMSPPNAGERGAQLCLRFHSKEALDRIVTNLGEKGIVVAQKDNVMRVAPVPLYNTFLEVWEFVDALQQALCFYTIIHLP